MNKFDIYKMIREEKFEEAFKAANILYFVNKTIPEETYDKLMDALFEAQNSKK